MKSSNSLTKKDINKRKTKRGGERRRWNLSHSDRHFCFVKLVLSDAESKRTNMSISKEKKMEEKGGEKEEKERGKEDELQCGFPSRQWSYSKYHEDPKRKKKKKYLLTRKEKRREIFLFLQTLNGSLSNKRALTW